MVDAAVAISIASVCVATIGGGVSLYNARKMVQWKRAEFANTQVKELFSNNELSFACRCLDWYGGMLVVPENLQPLLGKDKKTIDHDPTVFAKAVDAEVRLDEMAQDSRLQIYRTAADTLLTWFSTLENALDRGLFRAADIQEARYWLDKVLAAPRMINFIDAYGYRDVIDRLASHLAACKCHRPPSSGEALERRPRVAARGAEGISLVRASVCAIGLRHARGEQQDPQTVIPSGVSPLRYWTLAHRKRCSYTTPGARFHRGVDRIGRVTAGELA